MKPLHAVLEKHCAFELLCWPAAKTYVLDGFRHARAHVARVVLFEKDSRNG